MRLGGGEEMRDLKELSLSKFKECVEKYFRQKKNRQIRINIHISTELDKVKANVQGSEATNEFDILVSGDLKFKKLVEAIAHEAAHIVSSRHDQVWEDEKKEIKKYLEECLSS